MPWFSLPSCGFRLWRRKTDDSATPAPEHDQRQARPFSGATVVGSLSNIDAISEEKGKEEKRTDLGKRTISDRLLSAGAILRERSLSRSRSSKAVSQTKKVDDEKPSRLELKTVTVPGPYGRQTSGIRYRGSAARTLADSSTDSLDTPTSPDEKRRVVEDDGARKVDPNRDSKMKDETTVGESEAEARLRKMAEARRKFAEEQHEHERLSDFQLM
jgi:hypothetical protein